MIPVIRTYRNLPSILDEFFTNDSYGGKTENYNCACKPAVNVLEHENSFQIDVAAPGFERNELKVSIDKNMLTISSEPDVKKEKKGISYLKKEYTTSKFSRSFELPNNVETEKIEATHKNGVLNITIPKKAKVEIPVHEIQVN